MAKQPSGYIKKEAKVTAPVTLWDDFETIMRRRGCKTRSEMFREAMRMIVLPANGVAHVGSY